MTDLYLHFRGFSVKYSISTFSHMFALISTLRFQYLDLSAFRVYRIVYAYSALLDDL